MKLVRVLLLSCCMSCGPARQATIEEAPSLEENVAEHSVGGKAARDVFPDERVRELAIAACEGRVDLVERLLREGVDPNGEGIDDATPLIWAQSCESLAGVEALLRSGADPNKRFGGVNAVWLAADSHELEQLALLIRYDGNVNFVADDGKTVLIAAFGRGHRGDWANYEFLLASGADINAVTAAAHLAGSETTVAERAAALGDWDRVVELLERGYTARLRHLGRSIEVQIRDQSPTPSSQLQWRARAREMLIERGVQFPVGPVE
jgi:ankyrin repeat protein